MTEVVGQLRRIRQQDGLEIWRMDLRDMPVPPVARPALAALQISLMHNASARYSLTESVWLEATYIHVDGATQLLAPNARAWMPKTGFGIHPYGEPPRMWTDDDFSGAPFGSSLPVFNNQVFEIAKKDGFTSAINTMAGRGLLAIALLTGSVPDFKQQMQLTLGALVRERAFHAYPFFFPLLTERSAEDSSIDAWMGSAQLYMREDYEARSLVILTKVALEPCIEQIGGERQAEGLWQMPFGAHV